MAYFDIHKVTHIIMHHSAGPDRYLPDWGGIRSYHESKGWDDVGYHFGIEWIDTRLEVLVGRMLNVRGAHCVVNGMNGRSLGICVIGDFDKIPPPPNRLAIASELVSSLCYMLDIPCDNVLGHSEVDTRRTCPGTQFGMDSFRESLEVS